MNFFLVIFAIILFLVIIMPVFLKKDFIIQRAKLHELRVLCDYVAFTGEPVEQRIPINVSASGRELKYNNFSEQCVSNVGISSGKIYVEVINYLGN